MVAVLSFWAISQLQYEAQKSPAIWAIKQFVIIEDILNAKMNVSWTDGVEEEDMIILFLKLLQLFS